MHIQSNRYPENATCQSISGCDECSLLDASWCVNSWQYWASRFDYILTVRSAFVHQVEPLRAHQASPLEAAAQKAYKRGNGRSEPIVHISSNTGISARRRQSDEQVWSSAWEVDEREGGESRNETVGAPSLDRVEGWSS